MKVGTLFAKFAGKVGINTSDPKYSEVLAIATEIPDEDANKISGSLFTVNEAKDNLELKNYFRAQALDPADAEMKTIMTEMGFSTEDMAELQAEKNTYQRINKLTKKIQQLESKKGDATGKDKKDLTDQINALNAKIADIQKNAEVEKKQLQADFNNRLINTSIKSILNGKKYANKEIPQDVNVETALVLLNRAFESSGVKVVNVNGTLALKQSKDESLDWYSQTNEKLTPEQFIDQALAASKLLAVTDQSHANGNDVTGSDPPVIRGGINTRNSQSFQEVLNRNIANNKQAMERAPLIGSNTQ